jgi:hypothetical protein
MRKHLLNVVGIATAFFLYAVFAWQHELTVLSSVNTLWNATFEIFWGIQMKWGLGYTITLVGSFLCMVLLGLSLWYWED